MWQDHSSTWHTTKRTRALRVPKLPVLHEADLQAAQFLAELGLMLEQATGQEEDIPVAPVVAPYEHGKPFVTEKQMCLGTQCSICIDGTCECLMTQ